jgi:acyl-CoA synthetase (AMP-forming)/AMP-acid ligase II
VAAFGTALLGCSERAVIVVEPSGTVPADVLTDAIRRRIANFCGLFIHDVVLVGRGMVARTTSGKVRRAATKQQYERGALEVAAGGQTGLQA